MKPQPIDHFALTFPPHLSGEAFQNHFREWMAYRKPLGKVKDWPALWQRQLNLLGKFTEQEALSALEFSMANGWTGLFPKHFSGFYLKPSVTPDHASGF